MSTTHKIYEDENTTITVTESSSRHYIEMSSRIHDSIELSTTKLSLRDSLEVVRCLLKSLTYSCSGDMEDALYDVLVKLDEARGLA